MSETVYNYWVSFSVRVNGSLGIGAAHIGVDHKLDNTESILNVQDYLKDKYGCENLVIINFIELDE